MLEVGADLATGQAVVTASGEHDVTGPAWSLRLAALARDAETSMATAVATPMLRLKPGAKLVREWRGKTHTVLVLSDGFEHEGQHFTSLTRIAHVLTGAHWSGPRFFGLATPQRPSAGGAGNDAS